MNKEDLTNLLEEKHQDLFKWIEDLSEEKWEEGPKGKWTTGQHVLHLLKSIKLLNDAMSLPKFILRYKYGISNRALRDYPTVAARYQEKLATNQENAQRFNSNIKKPLLKDKSYILKRLKTESKKLQYKTKHWKDKDLDNLILPHPLMGKMPIREIVMWTAYHVEHHTNTLTKNY